VKFRDVVRAKFEPKRRDDLKPEAVWWIGREAEFYAAWFIDEGPYKGEWAMFPSREDDLAAGENAIGWIPLSDLVLVSSSPEDSTNTRQVKGS
jgi:hypothetical protein